MKPVREIIVVGDIAVIPLTGGHEAIIDAADVPLVSGVNWSTNPSHKTFYAMRYICFPGGGRLRVSLHRLLMNAAPGMHVDHCDGNGLNCRRSNMRFVTLQQNNINRGLRITNRCRLKGVSPQGKRFRAEIQLAGVKQYLGLFDTPELAHAAYCEAGRALHGEFWRPM